MNPLWLWTGSRSAPQPKQGPNVPLHSAPVSGIDRGGPMQNANARGPQEV